MSDVRLSDGLIMLARSCNRLGHVSTSAPVRKRDQLFAAKWPSNYARAAPPSHMSAQARSLSVATSADSRPLRLAKRRRARSRGAIRDDIALMVVRRACAANAHGAGGVDDHI